MIENVNSEDVTQESRTGRTPNGGVASVIYYQDSVGQPAPKSKAVKAEIVEVDANGNGFFRTRVDIVR